MHAAGGRTDGRACERAGRRTGGGANLFHNSKICLGCHLFDFWIVLDKIMELIFHPIMIGIGAFILAYNVLIKYDKDEEGEPDIHRAGIVAMLFVIMFSLLIIIDKLP